MIDLNSEIILKEKAIIWGASENGRSACKLLRNHYDILFVCDSDEKRRGELFEGYMIEPPKSVLDYPKALIIIAVVKKYNSIIDYLVKNKRTNIFHFISYYSFRTGAREYRLYGIELYKKYKLTSSLIEKDSCWSERKNTVPKKIAIFANLFPPVGGGGVQRPAKFAKYLKRMGYEPVIISKGYCDSFLGLDWTLLDDLSNIQIIRILEAPITQEELGKDDVQLLCEIMNSLGLGHDWVKRYFDDLRDRKTDIIPDQDIMWAISCINSIGKEIDLAEFSLVYTTIGPYSSALIGFYLKCKYGIKWILDYRDPWCLNDFNMKTFYQYRLNRWDFEKQLELALLNEADYVTTASNEERKDFKNYDLAVDACCITNGYDEDDFSELIVNETHDFEIVYNGFIYEHYELVEFVELLTCMIDEGLVDKSIHFCLNSPNLDKYIARIKVVDRYGVVKSNGYLPHCESLQKILQANILLVFGAYGEGAYGMYTGKIFEYLRAGVPIISFSSPYGVHYEMIEMQGRGITATMDDQEKIKGFICNIYRQWKLGHTIKYSTNDPYVQSFSRECLTKQLIEVIENILCSE